MLCRLINRKKNFSSLCNQEIVDLEPVTGSDADLVRGLVQEHQQLTGSPVAERLLEDWNYYVKLFVKVRIFFFFFAYSQYQDTPESFILIFFTRKV